MAELYATRGQRILFDEEFESLFSSCSWSVSGGPYARAWIDGEKVMMHRHVMGCVPGDGRVVDHISGDTLDNRRQNLRLCTPTQNSMNRGRSPRNRSGFKGVSRHHKNPSWVATITVDNKTVYLGSFKTREDAAKAYNEAALRLYGVFAQLNEVS